MISKPPETRGESDFAASLKKVWLPIAGFLSAITLIYNFYKLWLGDQETLTLFLVGGCFVVATAALLWVTNGYRTIRTQALWPIGVVNTRREPLYSLRVRQGAWALLVLLVFASTAGGYTLADHRQTQRERLVVVIAAFDGPEEVFGLRNEILERLDVEFAQDPDVQIVSVNQTITPSQGSEQARRLGRGHLADVVIWGWYRPVENPNITIHIENLSLEGLPVLQESETLHPVAALDDLQSFTFQQQAGDDITVLVYFLSGYVDFQARKFEEAILRFDLALSLVGNPPSLLDNTYEMYLFRGMTDLILGNLQRSIEAFDQSIAFDPLLGSAYHNRGVAYAMLGDPASAISDFDQTIALDPDDALHYISRGQAYHLLGDFDLAIQDYNHAIALDPQGIVNSVYAYVTRGRAYAQLGDYDRAIQDYNQAIAFDPESSFSYYNRGGAYYRLGDYDRAIQDFNQAIVFGMRIPPVYGDRGRAYQELGDYDRAIQDYNRAIALDPEDLTAYLNRCSVYLELHDYNRAVQDCSQAIILDPESLLAFASRAATYWGMGDYESAIQDFNQAIDIYPQWVDLFFGRGSIYLLVGDYRRAIQDFDQAIALDPQHVLAYISRGRAYGEQGDYLLAIQDFDQAIVLDPEYVDAYRLRGLAYQALGKAEEAEADFTIYEEMKRTPTP